MTKIYAVANHKGGVGKTTTAVNLAVGLAEAPDPAVLLIDLDPQGNAADSLGLRDHVWSDSYPSGACISFVLEGAPVGAHVIKTDRPGGPARPGLALLPASSRLKTTIMRLALGSFAATLTGDAGAKVEHILEERLAATVGIFDYIVLDCPPNLSVLLPAVYNFAQEVIVPVQAHYLSARGAQQHTAELDRMIRGGAPAKIAAIVPTMVDGRQVMARDTLAYLRRTYGPATLADPIPNRVAVKEAPAAGLAVLEYDPEGDGAAAYRALVRRLL